MTFTVARKTSSINDYRSKSEAFLKASEVYLNSALEQAEAGDLQASASFILKALDQERRAEVVGPQVLQLIKPTN